MQNRETNKVTDKKQIRARRNETLYVVNLVNFKTTRKSYKNKRFVYRDPSEWKIIGNHHEAIVDKETFDLAQKLTQVKRVVKNHFDDLNIFAGLLYCADCGFPITLRRVAKNRNYDFTLAQNTTDGRRFSVRRIRF